MNGLAEDRDQTRGVWFAFAAYGFWGVAPVYFKWVEFAEPLEILAHRIVWAFVLLVLLVSVRGRWGTVRRLTPQGVAWLATSATLVTINWGVFIWALQNERIVETSLGYYVNPLVNVVLGGLFLGERLRRWQALAVGLATIGVINEIASVGVVPWAGLALAFSFGFYGLVRKKIMVDSAVGLGVETTLLLPIAVGYLIVHSFDEASTLASGTTNELLLLALGGFVTVFPLVCFAAAALRLSLTVLGILQYLAPTVTLLVAVYYYGEPLQNSQWITFGCIWLALVIFSGEGLYHKQKGRDHDRRLYDGA